MRLSWLALVSLMLGAGCGRLIGRGNLGPSAQARPLTAPVYVQARQIGSFRHQFHWRAHDWEPTGVTLDLHNRSSTPRTVRLGQAWLRAEQVRGPRRPTANAIASGPGELPGSLPSKHPPAADVTLAPGEQRTVWVMFAALVDPLPSPDTVEYYGMFVVVPLADGPDLTIKLSDPEQTPYVSSFPAKFGFSLVASARTLGSANLFGPPGLGFWYLQGDFKTTLALEGPRYVQTNGESSIKRDIGELSLDVQWTPSSYYGLYAGGTLFGASDLDGTSWSGSNTRLAADVGLAFVVLRVRGLPISFRMGYTHVFDVADNRHAYHVGMELPFLWF